jgi:hypothetical protein
MDPGDMPRGPDAGDQAMTMVHSLPVGQLDRRLRPPGAEQAGTMLGHRVLTPSTIGTFLR